MDLQIAQPTEPLARYVRSRSIQNGRRVTALTVDDAPPTAFVADEVIVDADDREIIERLVAAGARVARDATDPELPEAFRRAGLGRDEPVDPTGLPRSVKLRFDQDVDASDVDAARIMARTDLRADRVRFADPAAAALVSLIAPMRAEGRGVWLNEVGVDHRTLPLRTPAEGTGLIFNADPLTWPSMTGRSRIADAWQLIETLRLTRSASGGPVFVAVVDSGFWWDAPTGAGTPGAHTMADLGTGAPMWNAVDDVQGVPTGPGRSNWHGTKVASAAAAVVGNALGAAGSGGSVARACYFFDDRTADSAKLSMIRCTQWGIPFVVYAGGFTSVEFFFGTSAWNDTFTWAANNGTIMIASAGNDDISLPDDAVLRPATRTPRALTVGALNDDGTKASFSNHGSSVHLWAPGVAIPVVPDNTTAMQPQPGALVDGTSFSAPLVAGVAAMVRIANPALTVDQVRDTLVTTGWDGAGPGGKGLDAYAAVWSAMAARMAETGLEAPPERLYPRADGTFEPIFNSAVNRQSDRDEFLLEIGSFSTLELDLQWYDRLSKVRIWVEDTAPDTVNPELTVTSPSAGTVRATAEVGSGIYRVIVQGGGPTAYLLSGRVRPGILAPDSFEENDTFETATRLHVQRPSGAPWFVYLLGHGPGMFGLTLHSQGTGPGTVDQDYFVVEVPSDVGALRIPQIIIGSDEPVDVVVFDEARTELWRKRDVQVTVSLGEGRSYYVRVSGATHTRYALWVGANLNAEALRRSWQEELKILPDWWEDVHPDWLIRPEEHRGIVLGDELLDEGELVLGGATTGVLPESVRVDLLDDAGELVREGVSISGRRSIDIAGLAPGPYVMRIATGQAGPVGVTLQPPVMRPVR